MRHGFILGIAMLYMIILGLQMMVTGQTTMTDANNLGKIIDGYNPETRVEEGILAGSMESYTNTNTGQSESSIGSDDFIRVGKAIGQMAFLYAPAIFTGNYLWFWFIFCFPIAITFWLSFGLALFRGVSSG